MNDIVKNLELIVNKQKLMNYKFPSLLNNPASLDLIAETEKQIGFKFNDELKELYNFADGCKIEKNMTAGEYGLIPIHRFLSLAESLLHYKGFSFNDSDYNYFKEWDTDYEPGIKLFPFLTDDAGNYYWVDLNDEDLNYGRIYWTNTYQISPGYAFNSLALMFSTIAQGYEKGIFFLDKDGYLDENYEEFNTLAHDTNHGTTVWNL